MYLPYLHRLLPMAVLVSHIGNISVVGGCLLNIKNQIP